MRLFEVVFILVLLAGLSICQLSDGEKNAILDAHNKHRNEVDPPASNMMTMEWNDELAKVAQDYADKCVWGENSERNSQQTAFAEVGENIGLRTGSSSDCVSLVDGWDREKYYYTYATGKCSSICDQYTQLVWADTTAVGCGSKRCATVKNLSSRYRNVLLLVCNYGPAYVKGEMPYESAARMEHIANQ